MATVLACPVTVAASQDRQDHGDRRESKASVAREDTQDRRVRKGYKVFPARPVESRDRLDPQDRPVLWARSVLSAR